MHTSNQIQVLGDPDRIYKRVFQLAADIQDWPEILPHYRYLRVLECSDTYKIADFGATRDGIPVKWRARQDLLPEEGRITYRHLKGFTTGMWVEWRLDKMASGLNVTIEHRLSYGDAEDVAGNRSHVPRFLRSMTTLVADRIIGPVFVSNIAGKTLQTIRDIVQSERKNS